MWLYSGLIHVGYTGRFLAHAATIKTPCICDEYPPLEKGANDEEKIKYRAMAELDCEKQCPTDLHCPLVKTVSMTKYEYNTKCEFLMKKIKKENDERKKKLRAIVEREEVIIYDEEDPIATDLPTEDDSW